MVEDKGTWEYEGTLFKRCPNCNKPIPASWNKHEKCGWGKPVAETPKVKADIDSVAVVLVTDCLKEALDIVNSIFKDDGFVNKEWVIAVADQIRRTKLMLKFNEE